MGCIQAFMNNSEELDDIKHIIFIKNVRFSELFPNTFMKFLVALFDYEKYSHFN